MQVTRLSLLERLRDPSAHRAWEEFYEMYWAVIVRYAQKQGLDEAAAHDALQETMVALIRVLPEFQYNPQRGRFRNFLLTIVHRKSLSALRRRRRHGEVSLDATDSDNDRPMVETLPDDDASLPHENIERQWRESVQEEALRRVRSDPRVQERSFAVFRAYVLEGRPASDVASEFGIKENAVYQIKDRLTRRLREEVDRLREGIGEGEREGES